MNLNHQTYFEEIGAWPRSGRIGRSYICGYIFCILLTAFAFWLVAQHSLSSSSLLLVLLLIAAVQFVVQIVFFLHLGKEVSARDKLIILACTSVIVLILTAGSVWIMHSLDQRMMPSVDQMNIYMESQQGM